MERIEPFKESCSGCAWYKSVLAEFDRLNKRITSLEDVCEEVERLTAGLNRVKLLAIPWVDNTYQVKSHPR